MFAIKRKLFPFAALLIPATVLATPHPWQGPYVGAQLGGSFGNNRLSTTVGGVTDTSYFTTSTDINAVNDAGTRTSNPSAMIFGIQAGHDWVLKDWVYGVAFDYKTLPLSSSSTTSNTYPDSGDQYSIYTSASTNQLFTLRGKLGYQQTIQCLPSLFYFTGGMAITRFKVSNNFSDNSPLAGIGSSHISENQIGWTIGLGIEVAVRQRVSMDFRYSYLNVPSVKTISSITNSQGGFGIPVQSKSNAFLTTAKLHANIFQIGLNYHFDE